MLYNGEMGVIEDYYEGWRYKYEELRNGKEGQECGVVRGDCLI